MPRPVLRDYFNITYRKIPILMLGREAYIDTSLQTTALEHYLPPSPQHPTLYPYKGGRTTSRLLTSYFTDRPFFRAVCGLMPASVWRSQFGRDRASLIGHTLDPEKLDRKIPEMMSSLDLHLSMLESLLLDRQGIVDGIHRAKPLWMSSTRQDHRPGMLDISVFYMLRWGRETALGYNVFDLTAGEVPDGGEPGAEALFERYPMVNAWFDRMQTYFDRLPSTETRIEKDDIKGLETVVDQLRATNYEHEVPVLPTPAGRNVTLDEQRGLVMGANISVWPSDTGMNHPSVGKLLASTPEEIVIEPDVLADGDAAKTVKLRLHFPRVEFRVKATGRIDRGESKL
ncbi:uncharacterized protein AB675_8195 [Cyphellophora attinorum]|uniref:GST N-terminal domain-containing protein n=1 Tax=Cyphellophora attinorum TaxID=1664694 RepID=A0A0N1P007_9EURO|nr:uncharacterized protein AB675_8195 [Phialophora attinorum]KPI41202.1 hypothetical protein AB675_8195 [Phialophora attinorum]